MDKEKQKEFTRRVAQSGRTGLLVVTYDILLYEMEEAGRLMDAGEKENARHELKCAQRYLAELMTTLDYNYGIAFNLLSLYEYVQRILVGCDIRGDVNGLADAANVIVGLRRSYSEIEPLDTEGPLMSNTEQVYAGLTYGKGSLNETQITPGSTGRGFLA